MATSYLDIVTDSLAAAADRCGQAHARVMELEDERTGIKCDAIKRLMEAGKATSVTAAEKIVELDEQYAAHRVKQREAEIEKWRALGALRAAELRARMLPVAEAS